MKRHHVTASIVIVTYVLSVAVYYQAPFLSFMAIPSAAGLLTARRRPRAGATVMALAGLLVLGVTINHALSGPSAFDLVFDFVCGTAAAVALVDGIRSAFSRTPVTDLAGR